MPKPSLQSGFFASMADPQAFPSLFEHLRGVFFFVKNADGPMIAANAPILERFGRRRRTGDRGQDRRCLFSAGDRRGLSRRRPACDRDRQAASEPAGGLVRRAAGRIQHFSLKRVEPAGIELHFNSHFPARYPSLRASTATEPHFRAGFWCSAGGETRAVKGTMSMKIAPQLSTGSSKIAAGTLLLSLVFSATVACAADWPSWGGQPSRNMASETEKGLPDWYSLGSKEHSGEIDLATAKNVKWFAAVGDKTYGSPVVSQGKVFIGTAGKFVFGCRVALLRRKDGRKLGRFVCGLSAHR